MERLILSLRLKRAFLLIDPKHGLKRTDVELLRLLRENAISHQVVLSKADRILFRRSGNMTKNQLKENTQHLRRICEDLRKEIQPANSERPVALGELISCSAEKSLIGQRIGINNLRWAVLTAAGLNDVGKKMPMPRVAPGKLEPTESHHRTPFVDHVQIGHH